MDFFSMLFNDPVTFAFSIMIVLTGMFAAYMKYHFIRNIKVRKKAAKHKPQSLQTAFSDDL